MDHELARFPPVLQLAAVALLAGYVALSLLARLSPRFRWLWRDRAESRTTEHLFEYTIVPALVFAAAAAAVVLNWDATAPLDGGWSLRELTLGPAAALLGLAFVVGGQLAGRRAATADASRPGAWVPLVAILAGIALLAWGVTTLGRTVKRSANAAARAPFV
jgi:hypothetical protein